MTSRDHKPWCIHYQREETLHKEGENHSGGMSVDISIDGDFKIVTLVMPNGQTSMTRRKMTSEERLQLLISRARENEDGFEHGFSSPD